MRICLYSYAYAPRKGGVETVSATLAQAWRDAGHSVMVATEESAPDRFDAASPFPVLRRPTFADWKRISEQFQIVLCNSFGLSQLPAWLVLRIRFVWVHQTYTGWTGPADAPWLQKLKYHSRIALRPQAARLACGNVFISEAIRKNLGTATGPILFNPVDPQFRPIADVPRTADFGFFGRMWLAKGQDTLLEALAICRRRGFRYTVDFFGDGEELPQVRRIADEQAVGDLVRFHGAVHGAELVRAMNGVGVVVVPSKWVEPLGVVALEAIACGKCVIASNQGGLGEVLNGWQPLFDNGNAGQLADLMIAMQTNGPLRREYEAKAKRRAGDFSAARIAEQYIQFFESILEQNRW